LVDSSHLSRFSHRIAAFYAAYFLILGVFLPFFPAWLKTKALSPVEISALVALPMISKVALTPLMTMLAGRLGTMRHGIAVFSGLGALPMVGLAFVESFWAILALLFVAKLFFNPVLPLADAFALTGARRGAMSYGKMRLWGSWSFIAANLGAGWLLSLLSPESAIWLIIAAFALSVGVAFSLVEPEAPGEGPADAAQARRFGLSEALAVLRIPGFLFCCLSAAASQASHGALYALGTVHWIALGYGLGLIGGFWALGVLAEIVLFWRSERVLRLISPIGLMALAGGVGMVRWIGLSFDPPVPVIVVLQILHGFTFGAAHLGIVLYIGQVVDEAVTPTAQAIAYAFSGATLGAVLFVAGPLYEAIGGQMYWPMALCSLAGLLFAGLAYVATRRAANPKALPARGA